MKVRLLVQITTNDFQSFLTRSVGSNYADIIYCSADADMDEYQPNAKQGSIETSKKKNQRLQYVDYTANAGLIKVNTCERIQTKTNGSKIWAVEAIARLEEAKKCLSYSLILHANGLRLLYFTRYSAARRFEKKKLPTKHNKFEHLVDVR